MDYYMQAPSPEADPGEDHGSQQYPPRQSHTGKVFPEFDTPTVDPNMLSMNQNMFEQQEASLVFPPVQDIHDSSWVRAANPLGPRDTNVHQLSINTAPPFASRPRTIPRRQCHSETSAHNRAQFNNQSSILSFPNGPTVPTHYSEQIRILPTFQSHDSSQLAQIDPGFSLVSPYSPPDEHPRAARPAGTALVSQVQSQFESFNFLPRKRARGKSYENSDVEHNNIHPAAQPHQDSSDSVLLEQNRLDFIGHWLRAFPDASLFNRTQLESLATLMTVPIETVEQLCNKLVRSQRNHIAGPMGNAINAFQTELQSLVPLPRAHAPQHISCTSEFVAVVQWVERQGPRCKPTSDHNCLTRKGSKIYQCTRACGSAFARKEDWVRHELCKNYPQEGWVCNLSSAVSVKGILICSSCGVQNPDMNHSHPQYIPCRNSRTFKGRVFLREDHFREHLRRVHHHSISALEQLEKAHFRVNSQFPSECGFCNTSQFESWESRVDHIADHFKVDGKDMKDWKTNRRRGLHNASNDDDDDDEDNDDDDSNYGGNDHDEEGGDDNEPSEDQDENNGKGARGDNFQNYGAASEQPPHDSGYRASGRSGKSDSGGNCLGNGYQYTSQSSASPRQQSHFQAFQDLPPLTNQSISLASQAVNVTADTRFFSKFTSKHIFDSECGEINCQKPMHRHFTKHLKTFTKSIGRKFQNFKAKEVAIHGGTIDKLNIEALSTARRAVMLDDATSIPLNFDDDSIRRNSTHASSSKSEVSWLEQRLADSQISWGTHWFIPADAIGGIVTGQAIYEELDRTTDLSPRDISLISHKIQEHARKIFAILVSIGKGSLVSSLLDEGITDENLPINIPKGSSQQKEWISSIRSFESWSARELDDFRRVQWYFLSPIFTNTINQHYELDDNCVMPFIKDTEHEARSGGFSDVWEVVIHPAHQKLFESSKNPSIALKRLHSRQYDDFKHEVDMLTALAQKKHNHLIKLLATYRFRGQYHLMFPFANSNLRQYWEQKEPQLSYKYLRWWSKQMLGLTSALCTIHNLKSRKESRYGRHGDIKPENILWFTTTKSAADSLGIFKIADLGLAQFHSLSSRSNVDPKSVGGSPTYVPPEYALDLPISRAYDIWSLGCIFLEFIVWLLDGSKGLERFASDRLIKSSDGLYDDSFFIAVLRSDTGKYAADVRFSVREWIRDLHSHYRASAFTHDMLNLIAQEMLVIRPQDRVTSQSLSRKLEEFATKAATSEAYVLKRFSGVIQPPKVDRSLDGKCYSLETLASIFYPSFSFAHLSRSSVSRLTTELCAPGDLFHNNKFTINFCLGFGPELTLDVCTFIPRNREALRTYYTCYGKTELGVRESLPITLNEFSVESYAKEVNVWLDQIIDSTYGLQEYVELMMHQQETHQLLQVLEASISWYTGSKNNLSEPSHQLLRPALKLLITTTLLTLVPRVTKLPKSLSNSLYDTQSANHTTSNLSLISPRLLTRQMKAAIHHLQQDLLRALFCYFIDAIELDSDVKILIAFLVAYTLYLVQTASRQFAKYVTVFSPTVVVSKREVTESELHMQTQLFDRVRASVSDAKGRSGKLATMLKNLDIKMEGKDEESGEHQFVSAILEIVL